MGAGYLQNLRSGKKRAKSLSRRPIRDIGANQKWHVSLPIRLSKMTWAPTFDKPKPKTLDGHTT